MSSKTARIAGLVATLAAAVALAAPAGAGAALPSGAVDDADWDVRHSWVDYVTNPAWYLYLGQGSLTHTGGSAPVVGYGSTSWGGSWSVTQYGTRFDAGSDTTTGDTRTVALAGGLDFDMSMHGIDISLTDLRVLDEDVNQAGDEYVVLDATYVPLLGTEQSLNDVQFAELVDVGGGPANQLQLTEDGATVFNGGDNGSYAQGDPFGSLTYNP